MVEFIGLSMIVGLLAAAFAGVMRTIVSEEAVRISPGDPKRA